MMRQPANAQVLAEVQALNRLFDEKAFSWTLAMEDLETVLPARVQVSNLEPTRSKDGRITLHMRVIGPRDRGLELVMNLEHSKRFVLPSIVGENTESAGGPNDALEPVSLSNRVNFDLLAEYNPATAAERKSDLKAAPSPEPSKNLQAQTHQAAPVRRPIAQRDSKSLAANTPAIHRAPETIADPGLAGARPLHRPTRPYPSVAAPTATGVKPNLSPGGQQ
jgi:type IV pilus assembly protein PilN